MAKAPYYSPGVYIGRVVRQSLGVSRQKQTPQFALTVSIIDAIDQFGHSLGVDQSYERTVYLYFSDNPKAMEISLKALEVLGFNRTSFKFLCPETPGFQDFTGQEVELYCRHEEYEGEQHERWNINTPRDVEPIDPSALRKLDALYGKGLKEMAAKKQPAETKPAETLQEAAANVEGADDPPF